MWRKGSPAENNKCRIPLLKNLIDILCLLCIKLRIILLLGRIFTYVFRIVAIKKLDYHQTA